MKLNLFSLIQVAPLIEVRVGFEHYGNALSIRIQDSLEALRENSLTWFSPPVHEVFFLMP